jgi:hypothetical protein
MRTIAVQEKALAEGANVPVHEEKNDNSKHEYLAIGAF